MSPQEPPEVVESQGRGGDRAVIACCGCTVVEYTGEMVAPMPLHDVGGGLAGLGDLNAQHPYHRERISRGAELAASTNRSVQSPPQMVESQMPEDPRMQGGGGAPPPPTETVPAASAKGKARPKASSSRPARVAAPPPPPAAAKGPPLGCCGLCPGVRPEEHEVMKETWWWSYCFCAGAGCTEECGTISQLCKCVCMNYSCEAVEEAGHDGVLGLVHSCCFCTHVLQWPPRPGMPNCTCCNMIPCGTRPRPKANPEALPTPGDSAASFWDWLLYEQHVPCYCLCCGCALHTEFQEICDGTSKCGGCRFEYGIKPPFMMEEEGLELGDEGLCLNVGSCWWLRTQCRVPLSTQNNPICALCGWRLRKPHGPGKPHPALRMQAEREKAAREAAKREAAAEKAKAKQATQPRQQEMV